MREPANNRIDRQHHNTMYASLVRFSSLTAMAHRSNTPRTALLLKSSMNLTAIRPTLSERSRTIADCHRTYGETSMVAAVPAAMPIAKESVIRIPISIATRCPVSYINHPSIPAKMEIVTAKIAVKDAKHVNRIHNVNNRFRGI